MESARSDLKAPAAYDTFASIDLRVARVLAAPLTVGTRAPCRAFTLDLGPLGERSSIGQYALVEESDLVGKNVIACVNLGSRKMGPYLSEALVLGAPHPQSPSGQSQALPLFVSAEAPLGSEVF